MRISQEIQQHSVLSNLKLSNASSIVRFESRSAIAFGCPITECPALSWVLGVIGASLLLTVGIWWVFEMFVPLIPQRTGLFGASAVFAQLI